MYIVYVFVCDFDHKIVNSLIHDCNYLYDFLFVMFIEKKQFDFVFTLSIEERKRKKKQISSVCELYSNN